LDPVRRVTLIERFHCTTPKTGSIDFLEAMWKFSIGLIIRKYRMTFVWEFRV
jgi:hypothetical protein